MVGGCCVVLCCVSICLEMRDRKQVWQGLETDWNMTIITIITNKRQRAEDKGCNKQYFE